jgi:hypothetical protein
MSVFNFIETFFLISLGITFVLMMFLVYHFRQRLNSLDEKSDTMFEIINNIIKEISSVKQVITNNMNIRSSVPAPLFRPPMPMYSEPMTLSTEAVGKREVVDEEDSETGSDGVDTDDDEDEDEDEDFANENPEIIALNKIIVSESDDEEEEEEVEKKSTVKVISLETNIDLDVDAIPSLEYDNSEDNNNEESETNTIPELIDTEAEKIIVSKEEISNLEETSPDIMRTEETKKENDMEVYRKMNIQQLKALIVSKGLRTDVNKLKKYDILKILEEEH